MATMGESTRRRAKDSRSETDRLPDFVFVRDQAAEKVGGFILAGTLVTDIPKGKDPSKGESSEIAEVIERLMHELECDPEMPEASIWRGGVKPPDGLEPPFDGAAVLARVKRSAVVMVRIAPCTDGFPRLDDTLMADVMGRH
jgi:hypothetical protein